MEGLVVKRRASLREMKRASLLLLATTPLLDDLQPGLLTQRQESHYDAMELVRPQ